MGGVSLIYHSCTGSYGRQRSILFTDVMIQHSAGNEMRARIGENNRRGAKGGSGEAGAPVQRGGDMEGEVGALPPKSSQYKYGLTRVLARRVWHVNIGTWGKRGKAGLLEFDRTNIGVRTFSADNSWDMPRRSAPTRRSAGEPRLSKHQ